MNNNMWYMSYLMDKEILRASSLVTKTMAVYVTLRMIIN